MGASERPKENQLSGYIVGLIFDLAFLYVLNRLPEWKVPVLTSSYRDVLWAVNLSLVIQVALNIALIFYHPLFFHYLGTAVMTAASIFALAVVVQVFPFDFTTIPELAALPWLALAARVLLLIAIAASAIAVLVNVVKFFGRVFGGNVEV